MKNIFKNLILLLVLAASWAAQAQQIANVYKGGFFDVGGTTEYSQYLYIGPGANITIPSGQQWIIASQYIFIDPTAVINGAGQMIIENPGKIGTLNETVSWAGQPTTVDGGNSQILAPVVNRNPNNIVLGAVAIASSGGDITAANTDHTLYIGGSLTWAATHADGTALTGNDVMLGANDLRFSTTATESGYDVNSFAVTNGTGHVVKDSYTGAWVFPVGIAEGDYTPATVTPTAANGVHVNVASYSVSSSTEAGTDGVDRTWNIYGDNAGGGTVALQHNTATNQAQFLTSANFVTRYGTAPNSTGTTPSQSRWQVNTPGASTAGSIASSEVRSLAYATLATSAAADQSFYTKATSIVAPLAQSITISGTLYNDANGLTNSLIDGTATGTPTPMYVNLVDGLGNVVATSPVAADGTYSIPDVAANTPYTLVLSTTQGTAGSPAPAPSVPTGWTNTGDGLAGTPDGTPNGTITIPASVTNVTTSYGIERIPVAIPRSVTDMPQSDFTLTKTIGGTTYLGIPANSAALPGPPSGTDAEDCGASDCATPTIVINTIPDGTALYYNGSPVTPGQSIPNFDPTKLEIYGRVGSNAIDFTYSLVDAAGKASTPVTYSITTEGALPIDLTSFRGRASGCAAALTWGVANAQDFSHFEVEYATDARNFTSLGTVAYSEGQSQYSYSHPQGDKQGYYRLKLVDIDGQYKYSTIVAVAVNCTGETDATSYVYPNPVVNGSCALHYQSAFGGAVSVQLTDLMGRVLINKQVRVIPGSNELPLSTAGLAAGIYYVRLLDGTIANALQIRIK